jgi:hypothetical protein
VQAIIASGNPLFREMASPNWRFVPDTYLQRIRPLGSVQRGGGVGKAVVATDSVSADADCDNGAAVERLPRRRGYVGPAAHRVVREAREEAEKPNEG